MSENWLCPKHNITFADGWHCSECKRLGITAEYKRVPKSVKEKPTSKLDDFIPEKVDFGGRTYQAKFDRDRLNAQARRVFDLMADSQWRTLNEVAFTTKDPVASISARLRDFRKEEFGSHTVNRRQRGPRINGLFEYQLLVNE